MHAIEQRATIPTVLTSPDYLTPVYAVYALVTLLTPANRPIAMQYIGCIERLISERIRINPGTLFLLKILFSQKPD